MTTTAPSAVQAKNGIFSNDDDIRAQQVAAAVAARKAMLAKRQEKAMLAKLMFDGGELDTRTAVGTSTDNSNTLNNNGAPSHTRNSNKQIRVGGAKGKEGRADQTRGKMAFKRPCTVGWKSQNQPLMKGGGNRTPL